jgi:hypothetical protein
MVVLALLDTKAGFDISQTLSIGKLSEGNAQVMGETEKLL